MVKCWASCLENCDEIQSREHYVSQGLWDEKQITIEGFNWLDGQSRTIPISNLTSKILCKTHNERLSTCDAEAIRLFKVFEEIHKLQNIRSRLKSNNFWNIKRYQASGSLFEKWAVKTVIGIACVVGKENLHWYETKNPVIEPPTELVKAVFGYKQFESPVGLYHAQDVGDSHSFPVHVWCYAVATSR